MKRSSLVLLASSILAIACGRTSYPETLLEDVLPGVPRENVVFWGGSVFLVRESSVLRWDGEELHVEVDDLPNGLSRFHTDGSALWLARRDIRDGWGSPEIVFERDPEGHWAPIDMPAWLVGDAVTGRDAWVVRVEGLGTRHEVRTVHRRVDGAWLDVEIDGEPRQVIRTSRNVYVATGDGFDLTTLLRWDVDHFTTFPLPERSYGLHVVDDRVFVTSSNRLVLGEDPSVRLPEPPPIPVDDPYNHGVHYVSGTDGTVLAVHGWQVVVGGYSNARILHSAIIDRFENGGWVPTARLDFDPAVVIDLGEGSLLVEWSGWQRVVPAPAR